MGIVLGIVVDVAVAAVMAAAEAATEAAADAAMEGVVEEAVDAATEGAAEAAAEAAEAGTTAAETTAWVLRNVAKFSKMIKEFCEIDAVFKAARAVLESLRQDPEAAEKWNRLHKSLSLLLVLTSKMKELMNWLEDHKEDTVKLDNYDIPLESGLLSSFMKPLLKAIATLQRLSEHVSKQNLNKRAMTDTQLTMMHRGIIRVVTTLQSLAEYGKQHGGKVPVLMSLPISEKEVQKWMGDLGCEGDKVLSLLKHHNYK
ncbi:uncharacterized protein LOC133443625 isoform X2 [Cololabis saira]|nr:uncharacterized protein LOC133443625 isoform X2 [Cololabis saira]